jgi:malate synthase
MKEKDAETTKRILRKIQKEREKEESEFPESEQFVTESYRKKLEETKKIRFEVVKQVNNAKNFEN